MEDYWVARGQPNWYLWAHEFSKHATCFSTFDLPCYGPKYQKDYDLIQFFETTIMYFLRLPTYDWLAAKDIVPSNSTSYTLSYIEGALSSEYGPTPYVGCAGTPYNETSAGKGSSDDGGTELSEVWYYFHSFGRPQNGNWSPTEQAGSSSCAKASGAVHYYERTPGSQATVPPYGNGTLAAYGM